MKTGVFTEKHVIVSINKHVRAYPSPGIKNTLILLKVTRTATIIYFSYLSAQVSFLRLPYMQIILRFVGFFPVSNCHDRAERVLVASQRSARSRRQRAAGDGSSLRTDLGWMATCCTQAGPQTKSILNVLSSTLTK